jgi:hypothetical protein
LLLHFCNGTQVLRTHSPRRTWRSPRAVSARRSSRLLRLIHRLQGTGGCEQGRGVDRYVTWSSGRSEPPTSEPTGPFSNASDGLDCVMDQPSSSSTTAPSRICHAALSTRVLAMTEYRRTQDRNRIFLVSKLPDQSETHGLQTAPPECAVDSRQIPSIRLAVTCPGRTIRFNRWTCRIPPLVPSRPYLVTLS